MTNCAMTSGVLPSLFHCAGIACRRTLLLGAAIALPLTALAEGSPRRFDCTITQSCNAQGDCQSSEESISLYLDPVQIDADGAGTYTIRYGDKNADNVQTLSEAGPFYWTLPSERNTLLISGDKEVLWHRVMLGAAPSTSIDFMRCSFRQ